VWLCAFADRSACSADALEVSRFSCMLFLDVPGSSTTPRPVQTRDSVASPDIAFPLSKQGRHTVRPLSGLNRPAHRCLCLRFAVRLATHHARLEVGIESRSFPVGLFHPLHHAGLSRRTCSPALPVSASPAVSASIYCRSDGNELSSNGNQCLNCCLSSGGHRIGEQFQAKVVTYADDFVILSRGKAAEALEWTRGWGSL
jgi:hypothetical protein